MKDGEAFLQGLDLKARTFSAAARTTVKANDDLCSWPSGPSGTLGPGSLRRAGLCGCGQGLRTVLYGRLEVAAKLRK